MKSEAQLSAEIERLQRSVEEQSRELNSKNRELEIEAALERVRTASMSMHKSDDLLLVIKTVHDQITELGIKVDASNFQTYIENSRDFYLWAITTTHSYQQKIKVTHIDFGMTKQMWDAWEKGDSFVELRSDADEMHRWWKKAFEVSELRHTPQHRREIILSAPGWNSIVVRKKTCGLQLHRYNLERFTEQEKDILKRLATVFEQSYTRFLDLQKAEKQAREAEIEAGLERVRSASMAMHRSEELEKVVEVTFRQLQSLALPIDGCQLITFEDQSKDFHFWSATPDMIYPTRLNIPYFDHPIFSKFWAARERGDTFISFDLTRQETLDFYNHLYENTNLGISVTKERWERIQSIEHGFKTSWGIQKNTGLWVFNFTNHQFTEEENSLIERFSKVFEQTYTRFLDLQKAEAQAREAQIEAALERVRARSIGMQKSKELGEVVHLLDTEVHGLGIMTDNVSIITDFSEIGKGLSNWFASRGKIYLEKFHIPFSKSDTPTLKLYKALTEGVEYYSEVYFKQEKDKYFKWLFKNSDYKRLPEESKLFVLNTPGWTRVILPSKNSVLIFQRFKVEIFKEEEIAIFKRFAKVFEQTYTRFLDLQKAEAQAKEAEIQLALERVRARTMAMQHSDELKEVVAVVFEKLIELGFGLKNGAAIIHIFNNDSKDHIEWVADPTQVFPRGIDMPFFENPLRSDMFNAWQSGIKYYSKEYSREIKDDFFAFTFQHTDYKFIDNEIKEVIRKTEKYSYTIAFGKNTAIGIPDTTGRLFTTQEEEILTRFAKVFEQTYTRFLDLKKAEAQAREAQIEAGLERVRSKAMAMHDSSDLANANSVVFNELNLLGISPLRSGIGLIEAETREGIMNATVRSDQGNNLLLIGKISLKDNEILESIFDHWVKKQIYCPKLNGQELNQYYDLILAGYGDLPKPKFSKNEVQYGYFLPFKHGSFYAWTKEPFSEEELKTIQRFVSVIDLTYNRYFDLKKAEALAREAQIEAALERIRSRSMAMHKTSELSEVIIVLFKQFENLNLVVDTCYIDIFDQNNEGFNFWIGAGTAIYPKQITLPYFEHPIHQLNKNARNNGIEFFTFDEDKKSKDAYFKQFYPNAKGIDVPESRKEFIAKGLGISGSAAMGKYSGITMFNYQKISYSKEENDILIRVNKVFQQTYTRFLDLKKAEAQAREAQIEASLERIRSASMAMHKSEELPQVALTFLIQIEELAIPVLGVALSEINNETGTCVTYFADNTAKDQGRELFISKEFEINEFWLAEEALKRMRSGKKEFTITAEGERLELWIQWIDQIFSKKRAERLRSANLDRVYFHTYQFHEYSSILFSSLKPLSEEYRSVIQRLVTTFKLSYLRFLDLQKAEAQSREAQIEAALERVRSASMAMNESKDLHKIVNVVLKEMNALNMSMSAVSIYEFRNNSKDMFFWAAAPGMEYPEIITLPFKNSSFFIHFNEARETRKAFFSDQISKRESHSNWQHYFKYNPVPAERQKYLLSTPGLSRSCTLYKNTAISMFRYDLIPFGEDENNILRRFGQVFEQTYTRFLDLQKAEAREKEAIKQSSLDRVRAEIASMRNTEDLQRITPLIWRELLALDVPFFRCGLMIVDEKEEKVHFYLSTPDGKPLAALNLDFESNEISSNGVKHWKKQQTYIAHWNKEEFLAFTKTLLEQQQIENLTTYQGGEAPPESLTLQFIPFPQGMLYVGSKEDLSPAQIDLVQNLADAFSVAYARYEDFKQLEDAKSKIELTLSELKSTQAQLIQSEKMASLGELTAGIAHEIQNPLNFVNNFSEVSAELVQELKEEIEKGDLEEVKFIANDLQENLVKINHHGKRAGSIVKGMLEHSRKSEGKKVLIDLNQLADECLRLSFHGLRAKDKTFHADYKTDFDPNLPKVNVVSQDIGRVLLNLINNAFQACAGQPSKGSNPLEVFKPLVTVSTKNIGDKIEISVNDNGPGIPDAIIEKIFQPFFTTKPTGSGTGLGLSLSYDIVKAHGGNLMAKSEEGYGALFIITLPLS